MHEELCGKFQLAMIITVTTVNNARKLMVRLINKAH